MWLTQLGSGGGSGGGLECLVWKGQGGVLGSQTQNSDEDSGAQEEIAASLLWNCTPHVYGRVMCTLDARLSSLLVVELVSYELPALLFLMGDFFKHDASLCLCGSLLADTRLGEF